MGLRFLPRRLRPIPCTVAAALGLSAALVPAAVTTASAATGCRVEYTVTSQWQSGFGADVRITNLGSAVSNWRLTWAFSAGQVVSRAWNATVTQSGAAVTATNAAYNGTVASGASVSFGFNGSWAGRNPVPASFALNGTTCTGATTPGPTPTTSPAPTPTGSPSATPTATPTVTPSVTPTGSTAWNPPARYADALARTWQHQEDTYTNLYGFRNYLFDQVIAAQGNINYCVRWDSTAPVPATTRDQVQAAVSRQFQKWIDQLNDNGTGWNGWPYPKVNVKVVGWAVRDRNLLQWSDNSVDIYVNNIREDAPQCAEPCGRFFHQNNDYSGCPGGPAHHYDVSLWLTAGMNGGAGGDWGQRIGQEYFTGALGQSDIHILLHEIGHGWGLNDFYDYDPLPGEGFVMKAGSATVITEFDKWMLRDFWRHLKNRYGL